MPIADSVKLGTNVIIHHHDLVNLYGCAVAAGVPARIVETEGAAP
jgi:hypothetical protein